MEETTQDQLIQTAMRILTSAGDARNDAKQARAAMREMRFEKARELMLLAKQNITEAHTAQTEIIQNEARGIKYEYCMLFNHAQDTLMTINSEIELTQDIIDTFQVLCEKLEKKAGCVHE